MEPVIEPFEIARVRLTTIRGFKYLDLKFHSAGEKPRKKTLIIGKNGTCKSSLLRAISIGLADRTDASRLISEPIGGGLISHESMVGEIEIELLRVSLPFTSRVSTTTLARIGGKEVIREKDWQRSSRGGPRMSSEPFVVGYGAGRFDRGSDSETAREYRLADSVYTLFNYRQSLMGSELTLRRLNDFLETDSYDRTLLGIKRALGLSEEDEIKLPHGGGVEISGPSVGNTIRLEAWADGYRMTFSWILDLYAWAMRADCIDRDGHVEGILLIDEIEQHLHPSMQAEILPRLSELFPKMQIFATTHSPLVALDAKQEELVVLRREGDRIVAQESVPDFTGYSAEDMLADPRLFDSEVYGQETREKLHEYRELALIPQEERTPPQRRRLRSLAVEVGSFGQAEDRESETTRVLKQLIAKHNL